MAKWLLLFLAIGFNSKRSRALPKFSPTTIRSMKSGSRDGRKPPIWDNLIAYLKIGGGHYPPLCISLRRFRGGTRLFSRNPHENQPTTRHDRKPAPYGWHRHDPPRINDQLLTRHVHFTLS